MKRVTPKRVFNISLILVFVLLVVPLYVDKGFNASMDHAAGTGTVGGIDFKAYYIAADMLRKGRDFYDVEQQTEEVLARGLPLNESYYIYPPLLAMALLPLTALSMQTAAQMWFFVNLVLFGIALVLICQSLELSRFTRMLPLLCVLAFLFPPVLFNLHKGQVNIVVLLLLALTYWLYRKGMDAAAGLALGLAVMIKVIPVLLLLYFVWKRKSLLILATVATIIVIGVLGLLIVGVGPHATYLIDVIPSLAEPRPNPSNQSLGGFFSLLLIENEYANHLIHSPTSWNILTLMFSVAAGAGIAVLCSRQSVSPLRIELELALVITTMPLIANIAWVDMFVLLIFPYAVLLKWFLISREEGRLVADQGYASIESGALTVIAAGGISSILLVSSPRFLDLLASQAGWQGRLLRNPLFFSLPFYGLVIVWLTLAVLLGQTSRKEIKDGSRA